MRNKFFNKPVGNIYKRPSFNAEITSQILYGERLKILSKKGKWIKIKTNYDNYTGYIREEIFFEKFKPSKKIYKLKSLILKKKNKKFVPTKNYLYFGSGISIKQENKNYFMFEKNKWIKKQDTKDINHYENNFVKTLRLFLHKKYLWGGKTSEGIDCSALIQIYFYYNRIFFPRDSKDQLKFCRKKNIKHFSRGDIIFWKGHVGMCIDRSKFIHAYGPKKKVIIMQTKSTIKLIKKTANLNIKKIGSMQKN